MEGTRNVLRVALFSAGTVLILLATSTHLTERSFDALELRAEYDTCVPCSVGNNCHAGCLTKEGVKQLKSQRSLKNSHAAIVGKNKVSHGSTLAQSTARIQKENADLLHLTPQDVKGLGGILNSVERSLLRAEAQEVKLRRQAKLRPGIKETIMSVYEHMSPADQRIFRLRARKFELDLHKAERSIVASEQAVLPIANAPLSSATAPRPSLAHKIINHVPTPPRARAAARHDGQPSWTSAMSQVIGSLVKDGSGAAWGYHARPGAKVIQAKARQQKLPGVLMNNWNLDKGALGAKPVGNDPRLPGVKAYGW